MGGRSALAQQQRGFGVASAAAIAAAPRAPVVAEETPALRALLAGLSGEQRAVVESELGNLRVLAGPGSGKTRVLVARIAHLARRHDAPLKGILAITFTTKAAREVRERLEVLLGREAAAQPFIGTFHAFALATLRRWAPQLQAATGVRPGFSIAEPGAAEALRGLADARRLLRRISRMKNTVPDWAARGGPASMALAWARWRGAELTGAERAAAARDGAWAEACAAALLESGALDVDDLLALTLRLLRADAAVLARVRARFRHVLVDEFQDTNAVQYDLVRLLVNGPRDRDLIPNAGAQSEFPLPPPTLFIVGDPAQAIYGWRGAEPEALPRRAAADFAPLRTLHLLDNYRSTRAIVEASRRVLGRGAGLALRALGPPGARVGVHHVRDAAAEAAAIARVIRGQLLGDTGVPPDEIAVLLRVNRQAAAVEAALIRAGVPYRLVGRTRLWERREVQDVVAYLRLALRPGDDLAARRVLNVPARGIGKRTLERLEAAGGGSVARALFSETDTIGAVRDGGDAFPMPALPPSIAPRFVERLRGFRDTVLKLRALASSAEPRSISQLFAATLDITGYGKALEEEGAEGQGRLRNLQLLAAAADGWVSEGRAGGLGTNFEDDDDDNGRGGELFDEADSLSGAAMNAQTPLIPPQPISTTNSSLDTLQAFLDWCAIASSGDEAADGAGRQLVTVMTMHMAKGLEFEAVLVPGCVEGLLPQLARDPDTPGSLEEEARLVYVAMTRAKRHLHLFVPQIVPGHQAFGNRWGVAKPSRFVQALERRVPHLLSHHTHDDLARR
ncbi:hypothetical protein QBZ16_005203 [Prototheca wickerhamii]|uniref:DNA 3'-5' helicase n=1 Tax=Prototheca wickerhamii TaxID=3111 RepID=A0AAD9IGV7_PROWI|nr:hypothetical protein QBZ16_005203 [Prototheca wickerhamii]